MKAGISLAASLAAAVFLASCATPLPPGAEPGPDHTMAYDVLVDASAPGASIRVNGQVVGNTPVHIKIFGDPDGTFHDFGSYFYVVEASPLAANQFPKARYYRTGHLLTPEDRVPKKIYFDMTRPAPQPVRVYGPPVYGNPAPYAFPPYYYPPSYYYGYPGRW